MAESRAGVEDIVLAEIKDLRGVFEHRFDGLEQRVSRLEGGFDQMDKRLGDMGRRLEEGLGQMEKRLEEGLGQMEKRLEEGLGQVDRRLGDLTGRLDSLEGRFAQVYWAMISGFLVTILAVLLTKLL